MTSGETFEGPRLIRAEDRAGSRRLVQACFGGDGDWQKAVAEEAGTEAGAGDSASPKEATYVITSGGTVVAQISIFHTRLRIYDAVVDIGSIGGVCTLPEYRGRGIATRLLNFCTQRLAEDGARLMVISGGRGLYLRTGNVPMGRYAMFTLTPGMLHASAEKIARARDITLRPLTAADALICAQLYQAEPVHFERQPRQYAEHFGSHAQGLPEYNAEEWLIEMAGKPAAYLLLNIPWESGNQRQAWERAVHEYAGSRIALTGAIAEIMTEYPIHKLHIPAAWQDTDLIQLLHDFGGKWDWTGLADHTWRIINFPGLMQDLDGYMRARLEPDGLANLRFGQTGPLLAATSTDKADCCAITWRNERLELDGAAMTRLVMGGPAMGGEQEIHPRGQLSEIIQALFPLPAFLPGLDYH